MKKSTQRYSTISRTSHLLLKTISTTGQRKRLTTQLLSPSVYYNYKIDVSTNFSKAFVHNLLYQFNSPYQEVISLALKYEKVTEDESLYSNILKDLLAKFHNSELTIIKQYHKCLSFATGINVGLYSDEIEEKNIFKHLERFFTKYRVSYILIKG